MCSFGSLREDVERNTARATMKKKYPKKKTVETEGSGLRLSTEE